MSLADLPESTRARILQAMQDSLLVHRPFQLFLWLQGELQHVFAHEIMLAIYRRAGTATVDLDVVASLPDVRPEDLDAIDSQAFAAPLLDQWICNDRAPIALNGFRDFLPPLPPNSNLHRALETMQVLYAHGVHDGRTGSDSLYAFWGTQAADIELTLKLLPLLIPFLDLASRRAAGPPRTAPSLSPQADNPPDSGDNALTPRELEILDWVRKGKTNHEIGMVLDISAFTVKNHLQHIFRKIDVSNRAQAVAKLEKFSR